MLIIGISIWLSACGDGSNERADNGVANNPPVATDDSYDTFGNTLLEVGGVPSRGIAARVIGSVLDNDSDLDVGDTLTVSLDVGPVSGSLIINADGNFSYTPPVGQTAVTDTFSYRVSDGTASALATVSINITRRIWYVDNRSAGGAGTSDAPFAFLAAAALIAEDGDVIYIANGDGSSTGLDTGLTLAVPNVSLIGEGIMLVFDRTTLAAAGLAPSITNKRGAGITLNAADNTYVSGLIIDGVTGDGLVINDSAGVTLQNVTISNSGESAIQGGGADVQLSLINVDIDAVDRVDPLVSDDAIFIAATASSSLVMNGGSINGVPGNLGDAIVFENADSANPVTMNLDIRGVSFSNIGQDGIKLDNENGILNAQIGSAIGTEGNMFDVGFRGIQIKTNADPSLSRINTILIQNNAIISNAEGIQIRNIADTTNVSILDNMLMSATVANSSGLIDVQAELASNTQARINRNRVFNATGTDGIKLKVFDAATLIMEAKKNAIDGPVEGFDFEVIETGAGAADTTLNASVLDSSLTNIGSESLNARNANATSVTCLDLQGNSLVADYVLDAVTGSFALTMASQTIVFGPPGGGVSGAGPCAVPTF